MGKTPPIIIHHHYGRGSQHRNWWLWSTTHSHPLASPPRPCTTVPCYLYIPTDQGIPSHHHHFPPVSEQKMLTPIQNKDKTLTSVGQQLGKFSQLGNIQPNNETGQTLSVVLLFQTKTCHAYFHAPAELIRYQGVLPLTLLWSSLWVLWSHDLLST